MHDLFNYRNDENLLETRGCLHNRDISSGAQDKEGESHLKTYK